MTPRAPNTPYALRPTPTLLALLVVLSSLLPLGAQEARPAGQDYGSFQVIVQRNIFNGGRGPGGRQERKGDEKPPAKVESFTLVGTMTYEKGPFAFFDSANTEYRKVLQAEGAIAGFKIAGITNQQVKLISGTNQVELRVGMQMRREDEGAWEPVALPDLYAGLSGTGANASTSAPAADENNEVLKRLMQKREQELK